MQSERERTAMPIDNHPCEKLEWDSRHFGRKIGRVKGTHLDAARMDAVLAWNQEQKMECLYLLADPASELTLELAKRNGFEQMDERLGFRRSTRGLEPAGADEIREFALEDLPELQGIAARSHGDSRFYRDRHFERELCDEMYRVWIRRSCGGWAERVWVAIDQGRPAGYCSCHIGEGGQGSIGLIAVAEECRGKGIGWKLLQRSLHYFAGQGIESVSVVTQGANQKACALYERCGFQLEKSEVWFHGWLNEGAKD